METKQLFCARCQEVTTHSAKVDANGEFVFTCQNQYVPEGEENAVVCGRFVKFPADVDEAKFSELITKHEQVNIGQVSLEAQEKKLARLLNAQPAPVEETPAPQVEEQPVDQPSEPVQEEAQPVAEEVAVEPVEETPVEPEQAAEA